jgi:hypothetical protein
MDKKFQERLTEYLDSECSDYSLAYDWKWNEDTECCEVEIRNDYSGNTKILNFRYNAQKDDLTIELSEDSFYTTREFDQTVKYFWMLICPTLFPDA